MNDKSKSPSSAGVSVSFQKGQGGLPMLVVQTPFSEAHVYFHGAHVTHFQRRGEKPVLFMSEKALFTPGSPIRGGIPVILPWFGPKEGKPKIHGFARLYDWQLSSVQVTPDGEARVVLSFPPCPESAGWSSFDAQLAVTVGDGLGLELSARNTDPACPLPLQPCLHTYFAVSDISQVELRGLKGVTYLDALDGMAEKIQVKDPIRVASEVDRVYENSPQTVEICDKSWQRIIRVEKEQSLSTVVWNPWIAKSQRMADFGDDEYLRMICVESGNVWHNSLSIPPCTEATLRVRLSTSAMP